MATTFSYKSACICFKFLYLVTVYHNIYESKCEKVPVKGYTKNHAIKNIPMLRSTTDRCGKTAGLMGLT